MQFRMSALVLKQVLPVVKERGFGRIINIGSEVFELGNSRFANYVAAKGAQLGLTRSWARELAPTGITVNLVAPGWIPTEQHADASHEDLESYAANVPMNRMGTPEDVATVVAFLASDAAPKSRIRLQGTEKERHMGEAKKCANPVCGCMIQDKFCSPQCEAAKGTTAITCQCGHAGCKGDV
jgi:NAD(P)-dependent dehydrogenase (short-subunit alcohol dehydrogenase family)